MEMFKTLSQLQIQVVWGKTENNWKYTASMQVFSI